MFRTHSEDEEKTPAGRHKPTAQRDAIGRSVAVIPRPVIRERKNRGTIENTSNNGGKL